jgi:hypothetical protein
MLKLKLVHHHNIKMLIILVKTVVLELQHVLVQIHILLVQLDSSKIHYHLVFQELDVVHVLLTVH